MLMPSPIALLIGAGAGATSAVLFAALAGGSMLALPLYFLTPLPLAIAALGWGSAAGLVAGAVAILGAAAGLHAASALYIGLAFVVPTLLGAHLLGLARSADGTSREWYPIGRVLVVIAVTIAVGVVIGGLVGGYDPERTAAEFTRVYRETMPGEADRPGADPAMLEAFLRGMIRLMPIALPTVGVAETVFALWAGAKIVARSGRLARPAEDLAAIEMPAAASFAFVAAIALTFVGGTIGLVAEVVMGAFFSAHVLVGFGVVHSLARRSGARIVVIAFVWGLILLFGLPLALVALIGLFEPFVGLRRRFPPPPRAT